jgi:hypothetical protein
MHGWKRNTCRILVVKPEGKITLEIPRRMLKNNIKTDRVGWYGLD